MEKTMFTLIKRGTVYTPEKIGEKDILLVGKTIAKISDQIDLPTDFHAQIISAKGKIVTPGYVDLHVHIAGGGGETPRTRTPEITLSKILQAGVTTVIGCLGTDDISRRPETLLAKAIQLEKEGISTYMYTGSYQFPIATITGSVRKDVALIPKVIGVGEIAISDHRSSQPSFEELCRMAAEARVGGMIGGKAGLVHLHVGNGRRRLDLIIRMVEETEIPIDQFLPTHLNRNQALLEQAIQFAKMGGNIDFTVEAEGLDFPFTMKQVLDKVFNSDISIEQVTLSSDSNGSMPVFDERGKLIKMNVGDIQNLYNAWKRLVQGGFPLEDALKMVTSNPAKRTGIFQNKGSLEEGKDADLLILSNNLEIESVVAKGQIMMHQSEILVKGTFEEYVRE
jgi:beta-aspartyl-dipeptidase (metallo-type)